MTKLKTCSDFRIHRVIPLLLGLAQLLDLAGERAVFGRHIALDVGEPAVDVLEARADVARARAGEARTPCQNLLLLAVGIARARAAWSA